MLNLHVAGAGTPGGLRQGESDHTKTDLGDECGRAARPRSEEPHKAVARNSKQISQTGYGVENESFQFGPRRPPARKWWRLSTGGHI